MEQTRLMLIGTDSKRHADWAERLASNKRFTALASSDDPAVIRSQFDTRTPTVLLVDVEHPPLGLVDLVREIARKASGVLLLGPRKSPASAFELLEVGARGYVHAGASAEEFDEAIDAVESGEAVVTPEITHWMYGRLAELSLEQRRSRNVVVQKLTAREQEILDMVAEGRTNKQIAKLLNRSTHTVKNHLHQIFKTMQVRNRSQAVETARRRGWIKKEISL